ncbi:MAG: hypothetical protein D6696_04300 [Acidobacteria bacterium]|nr:MAG: hypothetical protein D6696_04300 [Acidobacteriota bacterium]
MYLLKALRLFASYLLWRLGLRAAGEVLVRAIESGEEDLRLIAGTLLVRGGRRAVPLIHRQLAAGRRNPILLTLLGDLGDRRSEKVLERYRNAADPALARAARDALELLERRSQDEPVGHNPGTAVP